MGRLFCGRPYTISRENVKRPYNEGSKRALQNACPKLYSGLSTSSAARKEYKREWHGSSPSCIGPSKLTHKSRPAPKLGPVSGVQFKTPRSSGFISSKTVCACVAYLPAVNRKVPGAALTMPREDQDIGVYLKRVISANRHDADVVALTIPTRAPPRQM